jgi:sporulation protein YlmC with PRC-barrel domain
LLWIPPWRREPERRFRLPSFLPDGRDPNDGHPTERNLTMFHARLPAKRTLAGLTTCAFVALLGAGLPAQSSEETGTAAPDDARYAVATPMVLDGKDIKGKDVLDNADATIGSIADLAFTADGGVIALLRRSDEGFVGIPLEELDLVLEAEAEEGRDGRQRLRTFTARPARERIEASPNLSKLEAADAAWVQRVRAHYGSAQDDPAQAEHSSPAPPDESTEASPSTVAQDGEQAPTAAAAPDTPAERVSCLKSLVGLDVENTGGETLGEISGVAVNLDDKLVAYAIMTVEHGLLGFDDRQHGVPWDALRLDTTGAKAILPIERSTLDAMPGIDTKALPSRPDLRVPAQQPVSFRDREGRR